MFKPFTNLFTSFLIVCYISLFGGFNMYSQLAQGKQGRNCYLLLKPRASLVAQTVKHPSAMLETWV